MGRESLKTVRAEKVPARLTRDPERFPREDSHNDGEEGSITNLLAPLSHWLEAAQWRCALGVKIQDVPKGMAAGNCLSVTPHSRFS